MSTAMQPSQIRVMYIFLIMVLMSCASPLPHVTQKRFFEAAYSIISKSILPPFESGQLQRFAIDNIVKARVIAFAPPTQCKDIVAGSARSVNRVDLLSTDCGALMSELEAAAQSAGFRVISWRAIKDPVEQHAKENGVQLLIEINRFSIHNMLANLETKGRVDVFEIIEGQNNKAVRKNMPETEEKQTLQTQCKNKNISPDSSSEKAAIIDAKTIDALTGQVLSRHIHMVPTREESVYFLSEYYAVTDDQSPEAVVCNKPPKLVRLSGLSTSQSDPVGQQISLSKGGTSQTEARDLDLDTYLLRRTAQEFVGSLIAFREIYKSPASTEEPRTARGNMLRPKEDGRITKKNVDVEAVELLERASDLLNQRQGDKAEKVLQKLIEIKPDAPTPYYYLGRARLQQGHCKDAVTAFAHYIDSPNKEGNFTTLAKEAVENCSKKP